MYSSSVLVIQSYVLFFLYKAGVHINHSIATLSNELSNSVILSDGWTNVFCIPIQSRHNVVEGH